MFLDKLNEGSSMTPNVVELTPAPDPATGRSTDGYDHTKHHLTFVTSVSLPFFTLFS